MRQDWHIETGLSWRDRKGTRAPAENDESRREIV